MSTNYLVYSPCVYNRPDDNWLLDVELYSEEFRADLISIWMDEMGLISNPAMRKQVKNYRAYFNAKDRRLKVSTQNKVPETPAQLHMAVMAAICGLKDAQPNMILRSVFQAGLDLNNNTVYQDFVKYHADAAFWAMVRQGCGFVEEEPDLGRLAIHLLLTAATRTMRQEYLAGLDGFISEWLHSDNIPQLYDVARYVEDEARLYQRFEKLTVEDLVEDFSKYVFSMSYQTIKDVIKQQKGREEQCRKQGCWWKRKEQLAKKQYHTGSTCR